MAFLMQLCSNCFKDIEIKNFIKSISAESGPCVYCKGPNISPLIDVEELLDFFEEFFLLFSFSDSKDGDILIDIIDRDWNLFVDNGTGARIVSDLLSITPDDFKSPYHRVRYLDEIIENTSYWDELKESLKWKRRYLSSLDNLAELGWNIFLKQTTDLPYDKNLFRARLHHQESQLPFEEKEMGVPPKEVAVDGRANPKGIPYLYLSNKKETTLYETRVSLHDEVTIGEYHIKKGHIVSLVSFDETVSIFNSNDRLINFVKKTFLKRLISKDLSKPIRRYDSDMEYVPTQFICEYIRYISGFDGADGILFRSSLHSDGENIVLFNTDKVECVQVSKVVVSSVDIKYTTV